jgi:hypothetical protein
VNARARDACYLIETGRLDSLHVELASEAPERALPDRPWGGDPPVRATLDALATRCAVAAVHDDATEAALARHGFAVVERSGAWRVLTRR